MFENLARELSSQFGLANHSEGFVRMLLGAITDERQGGVAGFVRRLRATGDDWDQLLDGWLAGPSTAPAHRLNDIQIDRAFGASGLVGSMASKFGLPADAIRRAVGFATPLILRHFISGGLFQSSRPDATAFLAAGQRAGAAATPVAAAPAAAPVIPPPAAATSKGGMPAWLPWVVLALAAALILAYCNTRKVPQDTITPAAVPAPSASEAPAPATAAAEPDGAGFVNWMFNDAPALKVYFDVGQAAVAPQFADSSRELVDYLMTHGEAKAKISGFNDPTGDPAKNAELSKARAQAVQAALVAAGVPAERTELVKPADSTDDAASKAAARRVEVTVVR